MSRQSTSESTPRGILDTLRESKAAKSAAALGLFATLLAGCGKSGPEGWPENPCNVTDGALPVSQEDGSAKGWICPAGGRNDGLKNEDVAAGKAANPANIPTVIDTPTTSTPTTGEGAHTLSPEDQAAAEYTKAQDEYSYQIDGKSMSFEELQEYLEIPSNVTTPTIVADKLIQHMNEVANAGNNKEEFEANNQASVSGKGTVTAVDVHSFYGNAFAASNVHPEIDAPNDIIGQLIIPEQLQAYTHAYGSTRNSSDPFRVSYSFDIDEEISNYVQADQTINTPQMVIIGELTREYSGAPEGSTRIKNEKVTIPTRIDVYVIDGVWKVVQTSELPKQ